jgi:hypothetical protein
VSIWFVFVLSSLGIYRLTRFVVDDEFPLASGPRDAIVRWYARRTDSKPRELLADLVTCRYCASGWISLGVTVALATADDVNVGWTLGALWYVATWGLGVVIYNYAAPDEWMNETYQVDGSAVDEAALRSAVVDAAPALVDRVADLVNERLAVDPALSARGHALAAVARVGLAGALRYVLAEVPATQRADVITGVVNELDGKP